MVECVVSLQEISGHLFCLAHSNLLDVGQRKQWFFFGGCYDNVGEVDR